LWVTTLFGYVWTYYLSMSRSDHDGHLRLSLKHAKELQSHVLGQVPRKFAGLNSEWPYGSSGVDVPQHLAVARNVCVHQELLVPTRDTLQHGRHSASLQLENDRLLAVH
jgi:hypothetical protein